MILNDGKTIQASGFPFLFSGFPASQFELRSQVSSSNEPKSKRLVAAAPRLEPFGPFPIHRQPARAEADRFCPGEGEVSFQDIRGLGKGRKGRN